MLQSWPELQKYGSRVELRETKSVVSELASPTACRSHLEADENSIGEDGNGKKEVEPRILDEDFEKMCSLVVTANDCAQRSRIVPTK